MDKRIKSVNYNFLMNLILTASSTIFPLITFPYISRVLLVEGNGKASFAIGVIANFALFASIGIPNYGIRACARVRNDKAELSKVTQELLIINTIVTIIVYAVFVLSLFVVPKFENQKLLLLVASSLIWLNIVGVTWFYSGLEQYSYITKISLAFKIVALALMFGFVKDTGDYIIYTGVTVVSTAGSYIFNFINLRKFITFKHKEKYDFKRHLKPIFIFFATTAATTVASSLDIVMLGFMRGDISVGYYNVAIKVKIVLISVVTSLGTVLLPRLSNYIAEGREDEFNKIIVKSFNFILVCATAVSVYFMCFSKDVVLVLSGEQFLGSVRPMQLIMPTVLLIALANITGVQMLVPKGFEKKVLISVASGAILNIVLNFVLIPSLDVSGAAIATTISDVLTFVIQFFMLKSTLVPMLKSNIKNILKIIIALTITTTATVFLGQLLIMGSFFRLAITFSAFCLIYGLLLLIMKESFMFDEIIPMAKKISKKLLRK